MAYMRELKTMCAVEGCRQSAIFVVFGTFSSTCVNEGHYCFMHAQRRVHELNVAEGRAAQEQDATALDPQELLGLRHA